MASFPPQAFNKEALGELGKVDGEAPQGGTALCASLYGDLCSLGFVPSRDRGAESMPRSGAGRLAPAPGAYKPVFLAVVCLVTDYNYDILAIRSWG